MRPQRIFWALGLALLTAPSLVRAQDPPPDRDQPPSITVAYLDGRVEIANASGVQAAQAPDLLEEDDRILTADGRAELVYQDGSIAHLDRETDARVEPGGRLRLARGRLVVHTPRDGAPLVVATPAGVVRMEPDGEYDLAARDLDGDTVITAVHGRATFEDGDRDLPIAADDELRLDPRDRAPRWARAARPDGFREWATARVVTTTRARNDYPLPPSLAPYADQLSQHGQWSSIDPYGPVWIPTAPQGWRPYTNGSWRYTRYGWTWIDSDPWAWPVHHFGRWGHHASRGWYWIPQRAWGPAWVGWAVAADHVAWAPLGWDARPVVDFFVGARVGPTDAWANSWSFMPRHAFGSRGPVYRHLEDPRRLPGPVLGGFVSQMIGPRGPAGAGDRFATRPVRRPPALPPALPRERQWRSAPHNEPPPEAFGSAAPARPIGVPEYRRGHDDPRARRPGDAPPRDDAAVAPRPGDARPRDGRPDGDRMNEAQPDSTTAPRRAPALPVYRGRPGDDDRATAAVRPRREAPSAAASSPPPTVTPAAAAPASAAPASVAPVPSASGGVASERDRSRSGGGVERRGSAPSGRPRSAPSSTDGNRRRPR